MGGLGGGDLERGGNEQACEVVDDARWPVCLSGAGGDRAGLLRGVHGGRGAVDAHVQGAGRAVLKVSGH